MEEIFDDMLEVFNRGDSMICYICWNHNNDYREFDYHTLGELNICNECYRDTYN